jgi:GMP synthase (glutamine-hydrolysing)
MRWTVPAPSRYGPRSVSSTLLVLQHIACEPPAAFEDELLARGLELERVELDEADPLPDPLDFAATIVMGGPMGAYEEDLHPWIAEEKRGIGNAARAGHPIWGVCLGAQLLAGSLGARVYPGEEAEVGLLPVELAAAAAEDLVFSDAPRSFPTLQ